jgi:hypothetical protein
LKAELRLNKALTVSFYVAAISIMWAVAMLPFVLVWVLFL